MVFFYLKKNFCDGWDNLLSLLLPNLFMLLIVVGTYFLTGYVIESIPFLGVIIPAIGFLAVTVALFAFGSCAAKIANFKSVTFKEYLAEIKNVWKDGLLFGLLIGFLGVFAFFSIPFYFAQGTIFGFFLAAVLFWFLLICILALQYFLPLRSLMNNDFKKCLKKSFILFFDNPGFSIFLLFYTIILLVLSCVLFFMIPGFTGLLLAQTNALRLRLYKYDWYEAHPDLTPKERKHVPWDELIAEDYDTLGPRSLKSFIFPWK